MTDEMTAEAQIKLIKWAEEHSPLTMNDCSCFDDMLRTAGELWRGHLASFKLELPDELMQRLSEYVDSEKGRPMADSALALRNIGADVVRIYRAYRNKHRA